MLFRSEHNCHPTFADPSAEAIARQRCIQVRPKRLGLMRIKVLIERLEDGIWESDN